MHRGNVTFAVSHLPLGSASIGSMKDTTEAIKIDNFIDLEVPALLKYLVTSCDPNFGGDASGLISAILQLFLNAKSGSACEHLTLVAKSKGITRGEAGLH
eukprot:6469100-Amphidinium_carterae.2